MSRSRTRSKRDINDPRRKSFYDVESVDNLDKLNSLPPSNIDLTVPVSSHTTNDASNADDISSKSKGRRSSKRLSAAATAASSTPANTTQASIESQSPPSKVKRTSKVVTKLPQYPLAPYPPSTPINSELPAADHLSALITSTVDSQLRAIRNDLPTFHTPLYERMLEFGTLVESKFNVEGCSHLLQCIDINIEANDEHSEEPNASTNGMIENEILEDKSSSSASMNQEPSESVPSEQDPLNQQASAYLDEMRQLLVQQEVQRDQLIELHRQLSSFSPSPSSPLINLDSTNSDTNAIDVANKLTSTFNSVYRTLSIRYDETVKQLREYDRRLDESAEERLKILNTLKNIALGSTSNMNVKSLIKSITTSSSTSSS